MKKITIILFIASLLVGCTRYKEEIQSNNIKIDDKIETITDKGITIELDEFYYKDGYSTINLSITNNNDYLVYIDNYKVYIYDDKNNLIGMFNPKFDTTITGGDTVKQMFSTEVDFTKASKIKYEFNNIEEVNY